jgi:2-hydroxy-3-keto-5-methylthiopentenyl-1-phosphate phosphatase
MVFFRYSYLFKKNHTKNTYIFDFDETIATKAYIHYVIENAADEVLGKKNDLYTKDQLTQLLMKEIFSLSEESKKEQKFPIPILSKALDIFREKYNVNIKKNHFEIAAKQIRITKGLKGVISKLNKAGHQIIIIGGGYGACDLIASVVQGIISKENIYSGVSMFDSKNILKPTIEGFVNCATGESFSDSWKKSEVIGLLKKQNKIRGKVIHIGDGENDLEAWTSGVIDNFIGFGINSQKEKVKNLAPYFIENIKEFKKALIAASI